MTRKPWTEIDDFILRKYYSDTPTSVLATALKRSETSTYQHALKLGLHKSKAYLASGESGRLDGVRGASTRFTKGLIPWNKGSHFVAGGRSAETRFKKGNMSGAAQHNYVPIGSTRLTKDGYLERKVTDDHPTPARRWTAIHRLVWEAAHGPIPAGHIVAFKPGMKTAVEEEVTLDRLECISYADNMRRNTLHRYPKEIAKAIQMRGALNRRINLEQKHK